MRVLHLNLKRKWWEQIRDGVKQFELRLITDYWSKRLKNRVYDEVHLCLGYPKKDDTTRIIKRKWYGVAEGEITHEEFGNKPVKVFMIDVSHNTKDTPND